MGEGRYIKQASILLLVIGPAALTSSLLGSERWLYFFVFAAIGINGILAGLDALNTGKLGTVKLKQGQEKTVISCVIIVCLFVLGFALSILF